MRIDLSDSAPVEPTSSIVVAGDVHLAHDRWAEIPLGEDLLSVVRSAAVSVANLEAPLEGRTSLLKAGPVLSTGERTPTRLSSMGFDAVSLANNHIMDHGEKGLRRTIAACSDVGVRTFGAGPTESDALEAVTDSIDGTTVGVISLAEPEEGLLASDRPMVGWIRKPGISRHVESVVASHDVTILIAHGGIEFTPIPPRSWRNLLRSFTETGLDAIVAHHPHNPQGWEIHDGVPIFYSVGNFLMHPTRPGESWNYVVQLEITDDLSLAPSVYVNSVGRSSVGLMDESALDDYWGYLRHSSNVLLDDRYETYWQVIASDLSENEFYSGRYADYGDGFLPSVVLRSAREAVRVMRDVSGSQEQLETVYRTNKLLKESHRDVLLTALALELGHTDDLRSDAARRDLQTLNRFYDGSLEEPGEGIFERWFSDRIRRHVE